MIRSLAALYLVALSPPLAAQAIPQPSADTPRIQTVHYAPGAQILLTLLPDTPLTVMLRPGETVTGVTPGVGDDFRVRVSSDSNAFTILPAADAQSGTLSVTSQGSSYNFALRVEPSYAAALLVRLADVAQTAPSYAPTPGLPPEPTETWLYRLKGDREVRPASLSDDGVRTRIAYAAGQALPAVFAIGPTGEEEVVNGYMRGDVFVIDRVYSQLVFRIDRDKATARRNDAPEQKP